MSLWFVGFVFGFLAGLYFCAFDFAIAQEIRAWRRRRATPAAQREG